MDWTARSVTHLVQDFREDRTPNIRSRNVGNPPLLILDDATSAVVTISEAAVLNSLALSRLSSKGAAIMVAHCLASTKAADNIIFMGKGSVLEQGNKDTLVSRPDGAVHQPIEAQKLNPSEESFHLAPPGLLTLEKLSTLSDDHLHGEIISTKGLK